MKRSDNIRMEGEMDMKREDTWVRRLPIEETFLPPQVGGAAASAVRRGDNLTLAEGAFTGRQQGRSGSL